MEMAKAIAEQKEIEKEGEFAFVEGEFETAIRQATVANRELSKWRFSGKFFLDFQDSLSDYDFNEYADSREMVWDNLIRGHFYIV